MSLTCVDRGKVRVGPGWRFIIWLRKLLTEARRAAAVTAPPRCAPPLAAPPTIRSHFVSRPGQQLADLASLSRGENQNFCTTVNIPMISYNFIYFSV